jgi:hypothetical protein
MADVVLQDGPAPTVDVMGDEPLDSNSEAILAGIWDDDGPAATPAADPDVPGDDDEDDGDDVVDVTSTPDDPVVPGDDDDPLAGLLDEPSAAESPADDTPADDAPPEGMDDKQKHAFEQLAFEKRELKRKNAELETQLKSAHEASTAVDKDELFKVREELEAAEQRLGQLDLSQSKVFKQKYDVPVAQQVGAAVNLMQRAGLEKAEAQGLLGKALRLQDFNERANLLAEELPAASGALIAILEQVEGAQAQRSEALRNWKATKAASAEALARESAEGMTTKAAELTKSAVEANVAADNFMLATTGDPNSKWNRDVAERREAIRGVLIRSDPQELAKYVADGVTGRALRDLYKVERTRRIKAEKALAGVRGSTPGVGGGAAPTLPDDPTKRKRSEMKDNDTLLKDIWNDPNAPSIDR